MAKKAGKKAGGVRAAATSTTRAASTDRIGKPVPRSAATSPGGRRTVEGRNRVARAADVDPIGAVSEPPTPAPVSDNPQRPSETELTRLTREHETALATGQAQPHPTMAPRAARTSPDSGPVGHAHQPLVVDVGSSKVGDGIKVRATRIGYYAERRRRPGDVFVVTPREGFPMERTGETTRNGRPVFKRSKTKRMLTAEEQLGAWMELVDGTTPERGSTSADVLAKEANGKSRASDADVI